MDEDSASQQNVQHDLRELLDSSLPGQISQLEESTISLERVAAYCEANYIQSQNKAAALAETKRYALQSLASVAYLVGEMSRSLLHALELEQMNLGQKTGEIQNISQLVAIQKEKAARREIGKLTAAKNVPRQNKITYPATQERPARYQRTPIDFSILDGIGHGRRVPPPANSNDYGSIGHAGGYAAPAAGGGIYADRLQLNRTGSTTSGESGGGGSGSAGSGGGPVHVAAPIYDHYARTAGGTGTLTRASLRTAIGSTAMHDQYRVPQAIPSALQLQQQIRSHYQSMQPPAMIGAMDQLQQQQQQVYQQQRYGSTLRLNGHGAGQINNNGNSYGDYEQYGTLRAPVTTVHHQQPPQHVGAVPVGQHGGMVMADANDYLHTHGHNANNAAINDQLNNSADYSDDGLPLPPPLLLAGQPGEQRRLSQDDGFPLPPPPQMLSGAAATASGQQQNHRQRTAPEWIPQQYMEKAHVLYDYESRNQDELRLYQGAIVYVLRKNEDGWFEGVLDGITGLFPGNYVQAISN